MPSPTYFIKTAQFFENLFLFFNAFTFDPVASDEKHVLFVPETIEHN